MYEMPFGLVFRKAILWHEGKQHVFRQLQEILSDQKNLQWRFRASARSGFELEAAFAGGGTSLHRLPYLKTDCTGSFEVANNSLARATLRLKQPDGLVEELQTMSGAVVEMGGQQLHSSD